MSPSVVYALISIFLWSTLATLAVRLARVPPFFLLFATLGIGALLAVPAYFRVRPRPRFAARTIFIGGSGLFLYHLFLFLALRLAPPVSANLLNYLWPIGIVALTPLFFPGERLTFRHVIGAAIAATGAAVVMGGAAAAIPAGTAGNVISAGEEGSGAVYVGYGFALAAALTWALYSLWSKRRGESSALVVGASAAVASLFALIVHFIAGEPVFMPHFAESVGLVAAGIGPLGIAFYTWDKALRQGDPRLIGTLAYATPVLSTAFLAASGSAPTSIGRSVFALGAILVGAVLTKPRSGTSRYLPHSTLIP